MNFFDDMDSEDKVIVTFLFCVTVIVALIIIL